MQQNDSSRELLQKVLAQKMEKEEKSFLVKVLQDIWMYVKLIAFCVFATVKNSLIITCFIKYALPVLQIREYTVKFKEVAFLDHLNIVGLD